MQRVTRWFIGALVGMTAVVPIGAALAERSAAAATGCEQVENPTPTHHMVCPGQDLKEVRWSHDDLRYADFAGANLTGAHLRLARLDGANLSDAILVGALMQETSNRETNFSKANLTDANLEDSKDMFAKFVRATLLNVSMQHATLDFADMSNAQLLSRPDNQKGPTLDMANTFMVHATLNGSRIEGANWTGADLESAKLRGVIASPYFSHTKLMGADLTDAVIFTNWKDADLSKAILCNTYLQGKGVDNSGCPKKTS